MAESRSDDFLLSDLEQNSRLEESLPDHGTRQIELSDSHSGSIGGASFPSTSFVVNIQPAKQPECSYKPGDTIGRYEVVRELGTGGFGHVLLCLDPQLRRQVAIKIPRADRVHCATESFLEEGRAVARLDHNNIVRVFNIEETDDGIPFAVMEYVEGPTLRDVIRDRGLTFSNAIDILIQIADALEYAHGKTIIHRDLKPANVIITDQDDGAKLMDFGMALHDLTPEENLTSLAEGTPPYMAPEQVRGENHRLDRRTDIWGFGAMMYLMLTGQRPFNGKDSYELMENICLRDPMQPSRINKDVPAELERICLKCLEKLMNARYQSASEVGEDLKCFQVYWRNKTTASPDFDSSGVMPVAKRGGKNSKSLDTNRVSAFSEITADRSVTVVPKGLRSFDGQDAEFFLDLLPGPKDRFGIPDSLRFWLNKFADNSEDPLTVGLIFGPSGCGKSSFVKAGLVPNLPEEFKTIYLEATPHKTEAALLAKIAEIAPDVTGDHPTLPVALSRIRRGHLISGQKLLVVIDQFEQALQHNHELTSSPLVEALRHCDGSHLACILLIRDDFWMSATRFMAQLDLKVQEGVNALGIPLFDRRHARKVLTAYGRAKEAFVAEPSVDQKQFVAAAVNELSENGEIIPIHLSLFSQMMDSDSWNTVQLKKMGGWQGIGAQFLDKMFSDKRVSRHAEACREILKMLLPQPTSEIKGTHKSFQELARATGYENKPDQLQDVMDLLDREMRVVTLTEEDAEDDNLAHYQLTHDFLVNPIRKWITQKEKQTWQGRAGIRLDELSRQWQQQQDNRFMPSVFEYVSMFFGVDRKTCNSTERTFLRRATRYYGMRAAIVLIALFSIAYLGRYFWKQGQADIAQQKTQMLLTASAQEVNARLEALDDYDRRVINKMIDSELMDPRHPRAALHALFAKSRYCSMEQFPLNELLDSVEWADNQECTNIVSTLSRVVGTGRAPELRQSLDERFEKTESIDHQIRLAIVALFLDEAKLAQQVLAFAPDPEMRERFVDLYPVWHGDPSTCLSIINGTSEAALLSGLIKSIGQDVLQLEDSERKNLLGILESKLRSATEPVVFSCCQWLLERMGVSLPDDIEKASNNSWMVKRYLNGKSSLAFLEVKPHVVPGLIKGLTPEGVHKMKGRSNWRENDALLEEGFYMASSEVPASLFFKFIDSLEESDPTRVYFETDEVLKNLKALSDKNLPIYNVTWFQACQFCNWLSEREGLNPCYAQYTITFSGNQSLRGWKPISNSNGYHLPTVIQWDAANRAKTESRFCFGDSSGRINRYAITSFHSFSFKNVFVEVCRQKMPNDFGFFDLMGNVSEWCEDGPSESEHQRALRGGDSENSGLYWFNAGVFNVSDIHYQFHSGIRLVLPVN